MYVPGCALSTVTSVGEGGEIVDQPGRDAERPAERRDPFEDRTWGVRHRFDLQVRRCGHGGRAADSADRPEGDVG
jgi:hypothetical protein